MPPRKKAAIKKASAPAPSVQVMPTKRTYRPRAEKGWKVQLIESLPWKRLGRFEFTNLLFELMALAFLCKFTSHPRGPLVDSALFLIVLGGGWYCVFFACKQ